MLRQRIEEAIRAVLPGISFVVERPRTMAHGDYSTNAALVAKVDPQELAEKLRSSTLLGPTSIERIEVAGKFINFFLSRESLIPKKQEIPQPYAGKKIMVEYTQPNPFKAFHIGHLMSNALGESVARLLEQTGAEVIRANYQGDVGPHVAKALWGKMQKPELSWGEAYTYGNKEYEAHKEEIDAINKKVYERSDSGINALYDQGRAESLEHFERIYNTLGTTFDHYFFESESGPRGVALVKKHPELFEASEGALVYKGEHTRVFITSAGLPTYEAKDLGLAELKKERDTFDESITVTANEQDAYFRVVFDALGRVHPEWAGQFKHISHGMMRFADGKMSSRTGNVVTGESLLQDLTKAARGREDVAVGAVKYAVLKSGSGKDIVFSPEKSLSLEGDSGPYVQYALVRARALLKKAGEAWVSASLKKSLTPASAGAEVGTPPPRLFSGTDTPAPGALERILIHYPEVVARAAKELEPHHVTTYLTELAAAFNSWYGQERILGGQHQEYGLLVATAVEHTLSEGLTILGIPTPEEM